ncbi:50S ribosomal protein L9 [bacterium]|nr:50S ribosomal protein L9 [bacterium]
MKLILLTAVPGLGDQGDVVESKAGYAQNHLLPKGLALRATPELIASRKDLIASREREEDLVVAARVALHEAVLALPANIRIKAKAGPTGRLFGAVNRRQVATALSRVTGLDVERGALKMNPARETGEHTVLLVLPDLPEISLVLEVFD